MILRAVAAIGTIYFCTTSLYQAALREQESLRGAKAAPLVPYSTLAHATWTKIAPQLT